MWRATPPPPPRLPLASSHPHTPVDTLVEGASECAKCEPPLVRRLVMSRPRLLLPLLPPCTGLDLSAFKGVVTASLCRAVCSFLVWWTCCCMSTYSIIGTHPASNNPPHMPCNPSHEEHAAHCHPPFNFTDHAISYTHTHTAPHSTATLTPTGGKCPHWWSEGCLRAALPPALGTLGTHPMYPGRPSVLPAQAVLRMCASAPPPTHTHLRMCVLRVLLLGGVQHYDTVPDRGVGKGQGCRSCGCRRARTRAHRHRHRERHGGWEGQRRRCPPTQVALEFVPSALAVPVDVRLHRVREFEREFPSHCRCDLRLVGTYTPVGAAAGCGLLLPKRSMAHFEGGF